MHRSRRRLIAYVTGVLILLVLVTIVAGANMSQVFQEVSHGV